MTTQNKIGQIPRFPCPDTPPFKLMQYSNFQDADVQVFWADNGDYFDKPILYHNQELKNHFGKPNLWPKKNALIQPPRVVRFITPPIASSFPSRYPLGFDDNGTPTIVYYSGFTRGVNDASFARYLAFADRFRARCPDIAEDILFQFVPCGIGGTLMSGPNWLVDFDNVDYKKCVYGTDVLNFLVLGNLDMSNFYNNLFMLFAAFGPADDTVDAEAMYQPDELGKGHFIGITDGDNFFFDGGELNGESRVRFNTLMNDQFPLFQSSRTIVLKNFDKNQYDARQGNDDNFWAVVAAVQYQVFDRLDSLLPQGFETGGTFDFNLDYFESTIRDHWKIT